MRLVAPGALAALTIFVAAWAAVGAWPRAATNTEADVSSLIIESAGVLANEQVTVELGIDATAPGIGVATVDIEYDASLIDATGCTSLTLCSIGVVAPNTVRIVVIDTGGLIGSGIVLGSVTFLAGPFGGVAALTINQSALQIVNPSGDDLPITPVDGSITVVGPSAPATPLQIISEPSRSST